MAELGPVIDNGEEGAGVMHHGESLQALRDEEQFSDMHRRELKRLTRVTLDRHLEGRPLHSRGLFSRLFPQENEQTDLGKSQAVG